MKNKFLDTVKRYSMFSPGDSVVVGLSGGADSMCLACLLMECREELQIKISAVHVNHCIRGEEADRDEAFVREFCNNNGIPLTVIREDIPALSQITGESTELCARRIRYEAFDKEGADKIATAHTASDRIETFLFNLSRGASLSGLCSIPVVRANIVRPLIAFTRKEIEAYCSENNVSFVTDSSNLTDDYTRNRYRHNVIPELLYINPSFEKNALRCIEILNEENAYIDKLAEESFNLLLCEDGRLKLSSDVDVCILRRVIAKFFDSHGLCYENVHLSFICENNGNKFAIVLPGKVKVFSDGKFLAISKEISESRQPLEEIVFDRNAGVSVVVNGRRISIVPSSAFCADAETFFVDAEKLSERLTLRKRQPGDVFRAGKRQYPKQLKKIYNEMKIPAVDREFLYVLCDGQGIIFAENVGVDASRIPDDKSRYFLTIKLESVNNE